MTVASPQLMPSSPPLRRVILVVLFIAALALRIYGITAPPTEFHPMRQFRAAIIARDMYFKAVPSAAPAWERQVAAESASKEELLEPRIIETAAAFLFQIAGGEYLWLPRLLSALCWLIGGFWLYMLARKLMSEDAALVASAFYLLSPFAILASRVIQPDPMMVMLMLAALNLVVWYDDQPSWQRLVVAALIASLSPLVKPISIFAIFAAFAGLSLYRRRGWRGLVNPRVITFGAILALPMLVYYLAGVFANTGMGGEVATDIIPSLLVQRSYWGGWFTQIGKAVGPLTFLAALIGFALMKTGRARALVAGLGLGYLVMGLIFTYVISTHDYYQLQLIPIVALCLTTVIMPVLERVRSLFTKDVTRTAFVSLLLVVLAQFSVYENFWRTTFRYYYQNTDPAITRYGPEIGEAVRHSDKVIMLADSDGRPLTYYGLISGRQWPYGANGDIGAAVGFKTPDASALLAGVQAGSPVDYFVVTDFGELSRQPQLQDLLAHFPVVARTSQYSIYDLRQTAP